MSSIMGALARKVVLSAKVGVDEASALSKRQQRRVERDQAWDTERIAAVFSLDNQVDHLNIGADDGGADDVGDYSSGLG